jgi:DNA-binding MarR family transcriptional regulator
MRALDRVYDCAILIKCWRKRASERGVKLIVSIDENVLALQNKPIHLRIVGARLGHLMRLIRESGLQVYERELGLKEIHRQLIITIGIWDGLSSHELVALTGHEKAQVSRAIKPLEQDGLVARARLRAKLTLLPAGQAMYEKIMAIGRGRDATLTTGIAVADLRRFAAMTEELTVAAAQMYAEERRLSVEAGAINASSATAGSPSWPDGRTAKMAPAHLITPKLISLVSYLNRSAMLVYQRMEGLSHFQWQVLSRVSDGAPMPLARLILVMGRDKSQVGRTVGHLEASGLIIRSRPTRRRDILLEPTPRGREIFKAMYEIALQREEGLMGGHSAEERVAYFAMIDRLADNAKAMLASEAPTK